MGDVYRFLTGYLLLFSIAFFIAGLIFRTCKFYLNERGQSERYFKRYDTLILLGSFFRWFFQPEPGSLFQSTIIVLFRLFLIIVPVFLLSHNLLLEELTGLRLPASENLLFDLMTIMVIVGSLFLMISAFISANHTKAILMLLVFIAFITGFLSLHQTLPGYEPVMLIHILTGEILLIFSPFAMGKLKSGSR